ncbi:hypothetical protein MDOR_20140 [Mycolicibacterium doricum]|uniref:Uncharacterized protein n=1 Tax=Mycolicibacterium doricum TaxID=126673 RepID=A0A1X1TLM9_9MYCO|nr:hypothetical protein [Mycolicibacterium doricum]MCV7269496.1 hypothetical protein [Mycolicibacterium doricum]ORV45433.1 hypothetical protein AWC01_01350 [Mycolicibacterium doricum]BBZ07845.1 hypothetical protein MDOR_20140 [Mycolicibacterium doricum]
MDHQAGALLEEVGRSLTVAGTRLCGGSEPRTGRDGPDMQRASGGESSVYNTDGHLMLATTLTEPGPCSSAMTAGPCTG